MSVDVDKFNFQNLMRRRDLEDRRNRNRDRDRDMWTQQGEWSVEHGLWMGGGGRVEYGGRKEIGKKGEEGRY